MGITGFNFYHDEPLFGLDIGSTGLKVMQLVVEKNKPPKVLGYGISKIYPSDAIAEGAIAKPKVLGDALYDTLQNRLAGAIDTKRVACSVPSSHTFSRPMKLPHMEQDELAEAVRLEVEQYVPVPLNNLYLDWEVTRTTDKETELSTVAIPKKIVDSYVEFLEAAGLEPVALEPTMNCLSRIFSADSSKDVPSILIDFGSVSTDLAVFDKTMFVNSTIPSGIDTLVKLISDNKKISLDEAREIKNNKGISGEHSDVLEILKPTLDSLVKEVQKIIRYHNERAAQSQRNISQIVLSGGGATMPGVGQYLSKALGMPARMMDPWLKLDFGLLPPPGEFDRPLYLTVAGAATLDPKEIFA